VRIEKLVTLMPTQFRRVSSVSGIYAGHNVPLLGSWNKSGGYVKRQSLNDDNINEALACPIIAVVSNKFGNKDVTLTITAKTSIFKYTKETVRGDYTVERKIYEGTDTTISSTLTIPRYTRPYATFLITGLGQNVYEITSITDDADFDVGEIEFYALASAGSKIIYWMGIHTLAEQLRTILRPWIAPPKCNRCSGTGIDPNGGTCQQCLDYKYDGYTSESYVQRKLGFDVGLARRILNWDSLSEADHTLVRKFINQCWTQKWWVTPTVGEIKRLIRHFYMIDDDDIYIEERFHSQERVWSLFLPISPDTDAPFGQHTLEDQRLIRYIAESVTPAGVSVFVGFYEVIPGSFGDIDFNCICPMFDPRPKTSWEAEYSIWGSPRWDFYNGWEEAVIDFEPASSGMPPRNGAYKTTPDPPILVEDSFNNYNNINDALANGWTREIIVGVDYLISNDGNPHNKVLKIEENSDTNYYPGTYSFEDDIVGSVPGGWTDESGAGCTAQIIADLGGHRKVLELFDNNNPNTCRIYNDFTIGHATGTIEFWARAAQVNKIGYIIISDVVGVDDWTNTILLYFREDGWVKYFDGADHNIFMYNADQWYHFRIEFDCTDDWHLWIDGVSQDGGVGYNFRGAPTTLERINFATFTTDVNVYIYFDAISYSWDNEYIISDNEVEVGAQIYKDINSEDSNKIHIYIKGDLDEYIRIYFMNNNNIAFSIKVDSSDLYYIDDDVWVQGPVVNNNWHLLTLDLDCDSDQYDLYFKGNLVASGIDFQQSLSSINRIFFEAESGSLDYDLYCDCIKIDSKFPGDTSTSPLIDTPGYLYSNPHVESWDVNDKFRHECRLRGTGAYFDILYENYQLTGTFEWWWHPANSVIKNTFYDRNDAVLFYVGFSPSNKGTLVGGVGIVEMMEPNNDQHMRIDFNCQQSFCGMYITGDYDVYVNRVLKYSGSFTGSEGIYHNKFLNETDGTGFIDALGWNYGSGAVEGYSPGDNYRTLYPYGWGSQHEDCVDSVCGLLENYFKLDKVILT